MQLHEWHTPEFWNNMVQTTETSRYDSHPSVQKWLQNAKLTSSHRRTELSQPVEQSAAAGVYHRILILQCLTSVN
jgi:hypothetical protein